jgi:tRNA-2-methylthio-N6-dimethylallyladenosine synthase
LTGRFHIITMGCQMNEYDSDVVAQHLLGKGYVPAPNPLEADLVLINTCAVRARAEQKALSFLGRMIKQKKKTPNLKVGLMGCVAQQWGSKLFSRFPELDLVLGTRELTRILDHLEDSTIHSRRVSATELDLQPPVAPLAAGYFRGRVTAFLSIMEGCNNFCTYCVVPHTRGREASRSPDHIVEEAKYLISEGIKEITLLGQNVNSYSFGQAGEGFPSLLRRLSALPGLLRIRFTTSHPKDLSEELIRCFQELPNLCSHIHLPFQSGSDRILKRMNRGYTREQYLGRVEILRQGVPGIAITSDVMVGFPGETEEDFQETLGLIEKIQFDNLYSFKYSDRHGTAASRMRDKVADAEKGRRLALLQEFQRTITMKKNKGLVGSEQAVLVEDRSKKGHQLSGRSEANKVINFSSKICNIGKIVNVMVTGYTAISLLGETVETVTA